MNFITSVTLIIIALVGLTAFVFYMTGSAWSLLILILLFGVRTLFDVTCPKCKKEFTPFYDEKT
jgi:hypothetical protein